MSDLDLSRYAGHTAGPWHLFHERHGRQRHTTAILIDPKAGRPAVVDWPGFDSTDLPIAQVVANARLIADAPTLLAEVVRLRKEFASAMDLLQGERRYTASLNERLVKSDLAEIQRLRAERDALREEASERTKAAFRSNGRLQEKIDALTAERDAARLELQARARLQDDLDREHVEVYAQRDAALAKIREHNAAMEAECMQCAACGLLCARRHLIEVDA